MSRYVAASEDMEDMDVDEAEAFRDAAMADAHLAADGDSSFSSPASSSSFPNPKMALSFDDI